MNYGAPKRVEQIPTRPILNGGPALTLRFANSSTTDAAVLYCFLMKIKKINIFTRTYRQIRLAEQKVFDVSTSRTNWSRVNRVYGMILSASTNPPVISVTKAFKTRRRFGADYRKIITIPYRMNEHVISTSGLNRIVRLLTTSIVDAFPLPSSTSTAILLSEIRANTRSECVPNRLVC